MRRAIRPRRSTLFPTDREQDGYGYRMGQIEKTFSIG
mgnify:CR=1 FL=1